MKKTSWHYSRPELANKYLALFDIGLTSAKCLFARRRMGKTEFLKQDLIPSAKDKGYKVVYSNLWGLESDPATAIVYELYQIVEPKGLGKVWVNLNHPIKKIKAGGKISGIGEGSIEADLNNSKRISGSLLMEAMDAFDKTKYKMILIIDEAQVLAYEENAHFAHALRAALDIRKDRIKVIFAGSSETTLRRMFGVSSEPFYNWAPMEPFELLGVEFVDWMVDKVNRVCKLPLTFAQGVEAFSQLKNTPEFFRRYIESYLINPEMGADSALELAKSKVFNQSNFTQQWEGLLPADRIILSMIVNGVTDLHGKLTIQKLGDALGVDDGVNKNTTHNALRRLSRKNIITKIEYGKYQFEDEGFADWVKHLEEQ